MVQGPTLPATIVGVVVDIAEDGHATSPIPYVYSCDSAGAWPDPNYVVRTADSRALVGDLRRIVGELDKSRAVFGVRSVDDVLDAESDTDTLGKTAGKDARQNKPTYMSTLGLSQARGLVQGLREDALAALDAFGGEAQRLRELIDFIVLRSR